MSAIDFMDAYAALKAAGVDLPEHCRRIVVDIAIGDAVKVYYECYGQEPLLEAGVLAGIMIKAAEDRKEEQENEEENHR